MPGHFSTRVDVVRILWYQVYILENETVEIIDLSGLGVADVEELGAIELAHRTLLDDKYPIIQILCLQERMYVIHKNGKLTLPIAVGQYNGHVEEWMAIKRFPLATWEDTESTCHRHGIFLGMLLRIEQLRGPSTADGDHAGVIPRRVRSLHLIVHVLSLDEGVVGSKSRRMKTVAQKKHHRHGIGQPARMI